MKRTLLVTCLMIGFFMSVQAQVAYSAFDSENESAQIKEQQLSKKAFYADSESNIYYIDFENLSFNLNKIVVKNEQGKVLKSDNVFDLPVNTIYELDLNAYKPGDYEIELTTFTGVVKKVVSIK